MRDTDVSLSFSLSFFLSFFHSFFLLLHLNNYVWFVLMLTSAKFNSLQCFKHRNMNLMAKSSENAAQKNKESFRFGQFEGTSKLSFEEIRCIVLKALSGEGEVTPVCLSIQFL